MRGAHQTWKGGKHASDPSVVLSDKQFERVVGRHANIVVRLLSWTRPWWGRGNILWWRQNKSLSRFSAHVLCTRILPLLSVLFVRSGRNICHSQQLSSLFSTSTVALYTKAAIGWSEVDVTKQLWLWATPKTCCRPRLGIQPATPSSAGQRATSRATDVGWKYRWPRRKINKLIFFPFKTLDYCSTHQTQGNEGNKKFINKGDWRKNIKRNNKYSRALCASKFKVSIHQRKNAREVFGIHAFLQN